MTEQVQLRVSQKVFLLDNIIVCKSDLYIVLMLSVRKSVRRNIENDWRVTWWWHNDIMLGSFADDWPYGIFHYHLFNEIKYSVQLLSLVSGPNDAALNYYNLIISIYQYDFNNNI